MPRRLRQLALPELADITAGNAAQLKASWTFSTGVLRGHEGQPLVVDNTMYVVTPWPNVASTPSTSRSQAIRSSGSTARRQRRARIGMACCDVVNRGASYANGKLVYNLLDGHTVAVDAATGRAGVEDQGGGR